MAASTSTSADVYDVFINHRGPDVKKTLASHLYHRLISHGLQVFLDYQELNVGEIFDSEIKGAIKSASVHVAIFSRTYAESKWCLDELQLMLESGSPIIPVFYNVKPADLRWTRGEERVYARALSKLEEKRTYDSQPRYDSKTIENWRNALFKVSERSGFELDTFNGDEGELVDKVVECVLQRVKKPQLDVAKYPTGLEEKAQDFERKVLSQQHSGRVQVVGIAGLGGVGKTTLATELFNRKSSKYSKYYFLSDVREKARTSLNSLQANLLRGLKIFDSSADSVPEGKGKLRKYLSGSRVLLVLDDVDHVDQVDALLPVDVLDPESLILITSRDKIVLAGSGIQESSIYELTGLDNRHSRELFCSHAFCQRHPPPGFESLVDRFLVACQGLPLSLKVFGGLVYGNKDISDWEEQLEKLRQTLPNEIQKRLQISYDALDDEEKNIFLDIACFFIGKERDIATTIWTGSGWKGKLGFRTLQNKCLVELDRENRIRMHDHLRDLGRGLAKHPELPRRLWRGIGDIDDLKDHSSKCGITEVRGIKMVLMEHGDPNELEFFRQRIRNEDEDEAEQNDDEEDDEAEQNDDEEDDEDDDSSHPSRKFRKKWKTMLQLNEVKVTKLQLLDIDILSKHVLRGVQSPNLIWLRWSACHLSSLPWIPMKNLRVLEVHGSELTTLWQPKSKVPLQLRELRVFAPLQNIPKSIGKLKHLEKLVIESSLLETLPPSIGDLSNLKHLELRCHKLNCLPDSISLLNQLTRLTVAGCSLREQPFKQAVEGESEKYCMHRLQHLELSSIQILDRISFGEGVCPNLQYLLIESCNDLAGVGTLPNALVKLELRACCKLGKIEGLCGLAKLQRMDIEGCIEVEELPGFENLRSLEELRVSRCAKLKSIRGSAVQTKLRSVRVSGCSDLEELPGFENLRSLEKLSVWRCAKLKSIRGSAEQTKLRSVEVGDCSDLEELPGFENLRSLEELSVSRCAKLKSIRGSAEQTKLRSVRVYDCSDLEELPGFENFRSLEELSVSGSAKLKSIRGLAEQTKLRSVTVSYCSDLEELPGLENLRSLEEVSVYQCAKLKSIRGSAEQTKLRSVGVYNCSDLEELLGVENLRSLKLLDVSGCVKLKSISGLTQWTELETLIVSGCPDLEVLWGVENLRSLKYLDVSGCVKLKSVPSLAQLTELETLIVSGCPDLEVLWGVENLRSLKYLDVSGCVKLKSVSGLAQLTELRVLKVCGCSDLQEVPGVEHLTSYVYIFAEECPKLQWSEGLVEQLILKKRVTYIWPRNRRNFQPMDISVSNIYPSIDPSMLGLSLSRHWVVESAVDEEVAEQLKQRGEDIPVDIPVPWVVRGKVNSLDTLDRMSGSDMDVSMISYVCMYQ